MLLLLLFIKKDRYPFPKHPYLVYSIQPCGVQKEGHQIGPTFSGGGGATLVLRSGSLELLPKNQCMKYWVGVISIFMKRIPFFGAPFDLPKGPKRTFCELA